MTAQEFCYWLQGYLEIQRPEKIDQEQLEIINKHLALVFAKVTANPDSVKKLEELLGMTRIC